VTEAEWLACKNPHGLLDFFQEASDRKVRLFAAACCRRLWHLLSDERSRNAVEVSEKFADGLVGLDELQSAADGAAAASQALDQGAEPVAGAAGAADAASLAARQPTLYDPECHPADHQIAAETVALVSLGKNGAARVYIDPSTTDAFYRKIHEEKDIQCLVLRDILGNPFRPVTLDRGCLSWGGGTIHRLAQAAYDGRQLPSGHLEIERLAALADGLERAGCTDPDILAHLRSPGPHVRGCWAVDLLLGNREGMR
jgi:hypothetical protein